MVETGHKFHDNVSKQITWAHWFTFFNIVILSLISLRYIAYAGLAESTLGITYQFLSLIGHFSFLAAVVFGLLLFPFAFIISHNLTYRLMSITVATFAITFLIIDTQIFRLYNFHLSPLIWQLLQDPEQVEAIYSINLHYSSIPIIFTLEATLSFLLWKYVRKIHSKRIGKPVALTLFITFVLSHFIFIWADATQYRPVTHQKSLYPLSYPMTARTFLINQGWVNQESMQRNLLDKNGTNQQELHYPLEDLSFSEGDKQANHDVVIINIESLRADMLNAQNMPYLHTLSEEGFNFKQHFSGADNARQGVFSLFYGLPNSYWTAITANHIPPVFMEKIKEQQREIGLFSSIGLVQPEFLQSSFSQLDNAASVHYSAAVNNNQVVQQWIQWFSDNKKDKPRFSYLYLEQKNKGIFSTGMAKTLPQQSKQLSLYQSNIFHIDTQIKRVIDSLKQKKQYDNTIIIVTGTHGLSFKNKNSADAIINESHVPLIMIWPDKAPKEINRITSHVDIVPTLMQDIFSVNNETQQYSSGQHLLNEGKRQYVLSGDMNNYIIYGQAEITKFSRSGDIENVNWEGKRSQQNDDLDISLLIEVLATLRRFNQK